MLTKFPVIRAVFLFIPGIIFQYFCRFPSPALYIALILTFLIFLILYFREASKTRSTLSFENSEPNAIPLLEPLTKLNEKTFLPQNNRLDKNKFSDRNPVVKNIILDIFFFILGAATLSFHSTSRELPPLKSNYIKDITVYGKIKEIELLKEDRLSFLLKADSLDLIYEIEPKSKQSGLLKEDEKLFPIRKSQNILCTIKSDSKPDLRALFDTIAPGNYIALSGSFSFGKSASNPGEFNYRNYLENVGINGVVSANDISSIQKLTNEKDFWRNIVFSSRKSVSDKIDKLFNKKAGDLIKGMILADRKNIDSETIDNFINTGVIHIIVVSGLHVSFIAGICFLILGRFSIKVRFGLTILLILFFLFFTNSPAPVFRATIMSLCFMLSVLLNRESIGFNSLTLAALIILLFNPYELFSAGFQLSFAAVFSLLYVMPAVEKYVNIKFRKRKTIRWAVEFTAMCAAAQLGVLPLLFFYFGKVSLVFFPANFVIIPVAGVLVANGVLTIFTGYFNADISFYFAQSSNFLTGIVLSFIKYLASFDFSIFKYSGFNAFDIILFYSLFFFAHYHLKKFQTTKTKILLILFTSLSMILLTGAVGSRIVGAKKLTIITIDVGQGDATLIVFPDGTSALIDAGKTFGDYDVAKRTIIPLLKHLNISKLDYTFITHLDNDHYGGVIALADSGFIKHLYKPVFDSTLEKDALLESLLYKHGIPFRYYKNEKLDIGGARLYMFNDSLKSESENEKGGIIQLVFGETEFLFVGDAGKKREKILIKHFGNLLKSDMLKIGHHGSRFSSSEIFIDTVKPLMSVISAGLGNTYGHPSSEVVGRLLQHNSYIYRTDYEGAIVLQSDGTSIEKIKWDTPFKFNLTEKKFDYKLIRD